MAWRSDGGVLGGSVAMVLIRRSSFIVTGHGEVTVCSGLLSDSFMYSSSAAAAAS